MFFSLLNFFAATKKEKEVKKHIDIGQVKSISHLSIALLLSFFSFFSL